MKDSGATSVPTHRDAGAGRLAVVPQPVPDPLARLVEDYLRSCRARGLGPKTVDGAYGYPLRHVFLPWAAREGLDSVESITHRALEGLTAELLSPERSQGRGQLSRPTVHSYLRAVNQLLRWAKSEGEAVADRAAAPLPSLPKALPQILERDEIHRLEDAATTERDRLLVRVLADTGLRVGELVGLRCDDLLVRTRGSFLLVRGKGDRDRHVPVSPQLARRLERFIGRTRPTQDAGGPSGRIFLGLRRDRRTGAYEPLTTNGVAQVVRDLGRRVGLRQVVHPHLFRHSFVTWALRRGINPIQVAEIVGHTSLAMIQRVYAHLTPQDAHDALIAALIRDP
ncbi:MAG: tyrosine-type recombinase/integrase [Candidatus Dormibacteria bacterium]